MKALILFLCVVMSLTITAQSNHYQNLLNIAFAGRGLQIVDIKPISRIDIDWDMKFISGNYEHDTNKKLDTVMFAQIIKNAANADTTLWKQEELNKFVLVSAKDEKLSKEDALRKVVLTDASKIAELDRMVTQYNALTAYYRNIFHFSRPVFDDSKRFAIVQWDNGHAGRSGGGELDLYELIGDSWIKSGNILHWVY